MGDHLYLGREADAAGQLGDRLELDPADLVTHALIVGMTGSGKTGLGVVLIEEVLRQGIPVIAVDPKGDLGSLLLTFTRMDGASFAPWLDAEAARRAGQETVAAAEEAARAWRQGLAGWGLGEEDAAALARSRDAVVYTPGSKAGVPLNLLQSLAAPGIPFASAEEDLRDEVSGIVSGLLRLVRLDADPLRSREAILLSTLVEHAWRQGRGLTLESLVAEVADPPFARLGALPLEGAYPSRDRQELMLALNALVASPQFADWRQGEPLDVDRMLKAADGRPRLSIVHTAHLSEEERLFVTAVLLDKVKTWMHLQGGTGRLRAVVYMDEIFGYFPPHPADPPPKRPLLTLLKQARAHGLGVVLATQNPVDLDYKGMANMGVWMVGKLQTAQDRSRLRQGLLGAGMAPDALDALLDATRKRVFLVHDVHRPRPVLLHSRWSLSYLRGPFTRQEIERLTAERPPSPPAERTAAGIATPAAAGPPLVPEPLDHYFFSRHGGELADPFLLVKYVVRARGGGEATSVRAWPLAGEEPGELLEAEPLDVGEGDIGAAAPEGVRYGELPSFVNPAGVKAIEKLLRERLADRLVARAWYDPVTEETSAPGEDAPAFAARLMGEGGDKGRKLREQLDKKKRELARSESQLSGRKRETWAAIGTAVLGNIALLTGRRRRVSLTGASSVLTRNRMENEAEARVDERRAEVEDMQRRLDAMIMPDPGRFEERTVMPSKADVKVLRYDLLWVY